MRIGDLVSWPDGHCNIPGLILDKRPTKRLKNFNDTLSPQTYALLAMMPELGNDPEWFHECELKLI